MQTCNAVTGQRLRKVAMRTSLLAVCVLIFFAISFAQSKLDAQISVREVPPEAFPKGTCTANQAWAGYLGSHTGDELNIPTKEIGEYVTQRLKQGYSISIYPQASGRVFAIEKCESVKP